MATRRKLERKTLEVAPGRAEDEASSRRGDLLELITRETEKRPRLAGLVVGTLKGFGDEGEPLVDFAANTAAAGIRARSLVALGAGDVGRPVALLFEENDPRRPIVIGLIQPSAGRQAAVEAPGRAAQAHDVEIDGERLVLTAQKEIVLRCGKATIILTRAGKVLIRGAYLLNRSSGVNRIKGGSVQIN